MKYSFIVPTYNSEKWIQLCINSILAQTHSGFGIIILDSGSNDGTLDWIRSLGDERITIYTTDQRLNIAENWGRIVSVPKHEFMTIMGHDDVLYPDYLATIDQLITANPDAGLYQTHFNFIDEKGQLIRPCTPMKAVITPAELLESILRNTMEITATGFMVRSARYDAIGGIPLYPNLLYADIELWLKLVLDSYLAIAPANCFAFRFHVNNTSKFIGKSRLAGFEEQISFLAALKEKDPAYRSLIEMHGAAYLENYATGSCNKLIYIPKSNRTDVTMNDIIASAKRAAQQLLPGIDFKPEKFAGIQLAKLIDGNALLRKLFLFYKSFQKRTF